MVEILRRTTRATALGFASTNRQILWLTRRRGRREAVAAHDFHQFCSVRRASGRGVNYLGRFPKILWTYRCWCDQAQCLRVVDSVVIEPVNGAVRDAKRLSRLDVDLFPSHGPRQYSVDAVDRLLVVIVTMRWSRQALRTRDNDLECRNAATGIISGNQETDHKRPETDHLVGLCGDR